MGGAQREALIAGSLGSSGTAEYVSSATHAPQPHRGGTCLCHVHGCRGYGGQCRQNVVNTCWCSIPSFVFFHSLLFSKTPYRSFLRRMPMYSQTNNSTAVNSTVVSGVKRRPGSLKEERYSEGSSRQSDSQFRLTKEERYSESSSRQSDSQAPVTPISVRALARVPHPMRRVER